MGGESEALHRLASGLFRVADEMDEERRRLQRRLLALTWQGLAAEAVRGRLTARQQALAEAVERHVDSAVAVLVHAQRVEHRRHALAVVADRVEDLLR